MIISALLPSPYPHPRKERLDSKGTCDRGAQEGKTFEKVHEAQPVDTVWALPTPGPPSGSRSGG